MKKSKGIVVLLLTLILTVFFCFTAAVGIGPTGTGAAKHINTVRISVRSSTTIPLLFFIVLFPS